MAQQTAPIEEGVKTYYSDIDGQTRTFRDSDLETILDFPSVVLTGVERFPLPDGKFYFRRDLQLYHPPGEAGVDFNNLTTEQRRAFDLSGIKSLGDIEISEEAYRLFGISEEERGRFKSLTADHPEKVDDGTSIWDRFPGQDYAQQRVMDLFVRDRKITKERMQEYIDPYLERLEALVGQQVSGESIQPPWERERPRVFGTPAEYSLRFYDEGKHAGKRTTNIVLSHLTMDESFDEGPVAKIKYIPLPPEPSPK